MLFVAYWRVEIEWRVMVPKAGKKRRNNTIRGRYDVNFYCRCHDAASLVHSKIPYRSFNDHNLTFKSVFLLRYKFFKILILCWVLLDKMHGHGPGDITFHEIMTNSTKKNIISASFMPYCSFRKQTYAGIPCLQRQPYLQHSLNRRTSS